MFNDKYYVSGDQNVQVPAHLNFGKFMLHRLRRMKDEVALENAETGEKLTYRELTEYAVKLSVALTDLGVGKGDVVALGSERRLMFIPTALAIIFTGATYTSYAPDSGKVHLKHKMNLTKPKYCMCSDLFWKTNREIVENFESVKTIIALDDSINSMVSVSMLMCNVGEVDVDRFEPTTVEGQTDVALILYSSGTTGMPKGVMLTHLNCILHSLPHNFDDPDLKTAFVIGFWFHNYCTFKTFKMLCLGRKIVYISNIEDPHTFCKACESLKVNIAFLIPLGVCLLSKIDIKENYDLESLKIVYSRSMPLQDAIINKLKERVPSIQKIIQGYGMTEAGEPSSETWGSTGPRPGSVGGVSAGTTLKVVNTKTGEILGPNQHGEICLRGPVLMKGYIGIDPSTYLDEEGFYKTGDLGYYDEDGYFYIIGRLKEIIVFSGMKIVPVHIETVLLQHPEVREVAVVGKPADPSIGEEPAAFVVKRPGSQITEDELIEFVSKEAPDYMHLRGGVKFIAEIPKNPRGKVLRTRLREMMNE